MEDIESLKRQIAELKGYIYAQGGRDDLMAFTRAMMPTYECAAHHRLISDKLMAVERGEIKRLMIFMPPRSGKSTLASIYFPAWFIGKNPTKQIITASYSGRLSEDFGRKVRNTISDPEYGKIFSETQLAQDSKASNRWHTNKDGVYMAVGVQGATTGRGADLFLIDDPIRDAAEADSELIRDKVWDWFATVAYTRLQPNGAIVVVQTRWHEDDLSGRLLEDMKNGGQQWDILRLPAIAEYDDVLGREVGAALWPEWYSLETLEETRRILSTQGGNRYWSAMYQQNPVPDDGEFFNREWINYYEERPKTSSLTIYATSDYAVTDKGGDYTVHMVFGIDQEANIYVLDCYRAQSSSDEWVEVQITMMKEWKPLEWVGERGQIESSVGPFLRQIMKERRVYCNINSLPSIQSKAQRAQSIRGRTAMGKLYFPKHAHWTDDVVSEMLHFPHGKNDDAVDCLSLMGRILDTTWSRGFGVVRRKNTDLRYGANIIEGARQAELNVMELA